MFFVKSLVSARWSVNRVPTDVVPGLIVVFADERDADAVCAPDDGRPRGERVPQDVVDAALADVTADGGEVKIVTGKPRGDDDDEAGVSLAQHTDNTKASAAGETPPHKPKSKRGKAK